MKLQIGVKILLKNASGELLMLRRTEEVDHGGMAVWDIPGGRIAENEHLDEALVREVKEETGLELSDRKEFLAAQDIFASSKDLHVVRLTYLGEATGTITLDHEHDDYQWLSVDDIRKIDKLDPYLSIVIESIFSDSRLKDESKLPTITPGDYMHTKSGKKYKVLGIALQTETDALLVIYKPLYESSFKFFARPYETFISQTEIDGKLIPRFKKL